MRGARSRARRRCPACCDGMQWWRPRCESCRPLQASLLALQPTHAVCVLRPSLQRTRTRSEGSWLLEKTCRARQGPPEALRAPPALTTRGRALWPAAVLDHAPRPPARACAWMHWRARRCCRVESPSLPCKRFIPCSACVNWRLCCSHAQSRLEMHGRPPPPPPRGGPEASAAPHACFTDPGSYSAGHSLSVITI